MAKATCHVNGTTGALNRAQGVSQLYKAGTGDYHVIFPPGYDPASAEHHFSVQPINAAARIATLGNAGSAAPPGGANAAAGSTSVQILTWDAAGAAADSDFMFEANPV